MKIECTREELKVLLDQLSKASEALNIVRSALLQISPNYHYSTDTRTNEFHLKIAPGIEFDGRFIDDSANP